MVVRIRECRGSIDQAEVIWGESVTHFTSASVEGMALNPILHPNRAHCLPKILLSLASDLLSHFFSHGVFSLVLDSNASHRATLLFYAITRDGKRQDVWTPGIAYTLCYPYFRAYICLLCILT